MTIKRYGTSSMECENGIYVLHAEYEKVVAECERLRAANRELHRRAQQIEAPRDQCKALIRQANDHWGDTWVHEFNRLIAAHTEIKGMFLELARAYEYPQGGKHLHSCMDSNVELPREKHDGVWVNCFLTRQGGVKSIRVLDEVRRVVDELLQLRNLESAVRDHRAMYEGTSDEDNMSALSIGDAISQLDAARKEQA